MRRAIIEKLFGKGDKNLAEISKRCGVHVNTVSKHHSAMRRWILGDLNTKAQGIESIAWERIEQRFSELGLLENNEIPTIA